ncbi:class F sortase [Micromonospora sp. CPCC 206060]|uniref:class F sortase n=1 Tax=Micromonospora sp. CPCC 206060 TaxID=3122406 RepID=UPI002FF115CA
MTRSSTRGDARSAGTARRAVRRAGASLARLAGQVGTAGVTSAEPGARPATGGWGRSTRRMMVGGSGPGLPVILVMALMVAILGMFGFERATGIPVLPSALTAGFRLPPKKFPVLDPSPPVSISIRKIRLDAPVHGVGIAADGSIGVPDASRVHEAAWYDQSPTPGQYGPSVIVGHVDDQSGPAVFHDLRNLRAGDRIEVTRTDRSVAIFEVDRVGQYDKGQLPGQEVFGDFSRPNLRLITCGGRWVGGDTGYADNVVVFASLVRARHP